jgi:hypothetical protein
VRVRLFGRAGLQGAGPAGPAFEQTITALEPAGDNRIAPIVAAHDKAVIDVLGQVVDSAPSGPSRKLLSTGPPNQCPDEVVPHGIPIRNRRGRGLGRHTWRYSNLGAALM